MTDAAKPEQIEEMCEIFDAHAKDLGWGRHIYSDQLRALAARVAELEAQQPAFDVSDDENETLQKLVGWVAGADNPRDRSEIKGTWISNLLELLWDERKKLTRQPPQAVTVKPLEWIEDCCFHCSEWLYCETDFGQYNAYSPHEKPGSYFWLVEDGAIAPEGGPFDSMDQAQAEAQSDYDRRKLKDVFARPESDVRDEAAQAVLNKIAACAHAMGHQSGEPAVNIAGFTLSFLTTHPEHIERYMSEGNELWIDGTITFEGGWLSYLANDGEIRSPSELRALTKGGA